MQTQDRLRDPDGDPGRPQRRRRWTLLHVGVALAAGLTVREIAKQHGVRVSEINQRLEALREELTASAP